MRLLLEARALAGKYSFNFHRQKVANAQRSLNEEVASVTLSAQKKQKELALLLEQTEAGNQQRGQSFRPTTLSIWASN